MGYRSGLLGTTLVVLAAAGAGLGMLSRVSEIQSRQEKVDPDRTDYADLMRDLIKLGLVRIDGARIHLPSPDHALIRAAMRLTSGPEHSVARDGDEDEAVRRLYGSMSGTYLLRQVELHNRTRAIVALRDDRLSGQAFSFQQPQAASGWSMAALDGEDRPPRRLAKAVLPEEIGFVTQPLARGMTDWVTFAVDGQKARFRTRLPAGAGERVIEVVGRVVAVDPVPLRIEPRCMGTPCGDHDLQGARVYLPPMEQEREVTIVLEPLRNPDLYVPGLNLRLEGNKISWREAPTTPAERMGPATMPVGPISTSDGVALTQADGMPTEQARVLGLLPITGIGPEDARNLPLALASDPRLTSGLPATLTIDSHVQVAMIKALETLDLPPEMGGAAAHPDQAVLTAIDVETGAIVGAAQWPFLPADAHPWDLQRLAALPADRDLLTPAAWQGKGVRTGPGSTNKVLDSMVLLDNAEDPAIQAMITGCAPRADGSFPCLNLRLTGTAYGMPGQSQPVKNLALNESGSWRMTLGMSLSKPQRSAQCQADPVRSNGVGLLEALRDSVNTFFIRAAELLDGSDALRYDRASRRLQEGQSLAPPVSRLVAMADRIGLLTPFSLSGAAQSAQAGGMRSRLDAQAASMDIATIARREPGFKGQGAVDATAQCYIGQRCHYTALHGAMLAQVAARGRPMRPYLVSGSGDRSLDPPKAGEPLGFDLAPLQAGMKAVTETGTAAGPQAFGGWSARFTGAVCHVFGKTGSAQVSRSGVEGTTAWFIGWAEPQAFDALALGATPARRRAIAFSCMATGNHGAHSTGGSVCAPLVARMLEGVASPQADWRQASLGSFLNIPFSGEGSNLP
ncbi:penicillin-binding transpeptidase domain-containing protein [Niveispirillum sp.]|uniref:penicillin-binding transpeptidase domain-containing protein n=1 Tax=Niveispirillum sp. TaxID=1917217 RepID=UPI001B615077|nr:penicillin-binding transpeptidase domain-containing protein [Niveispirillum sp.]MBP7335874.1 hypothetical protein [Niveispirillum sp.]